jgi:hypothetical protein
MRTSVPRAVLAFLCLAIVATSSPAARAVADSARPTPYQVAEPTPEAAQPPLGAAYTDISPDGTCASGFTAFVVARGVQECYTPDPVVENGNLQNTCPTDPSLFVCPGQAD